MMDRLQRAGFAGTPRLLSVSGDMTIEEDAGGLTALQIRPPEGALEAAIDALAAFHALDPGATRPAEELLPDDDPPLFRLGFSAAEREPALEPLRQARALLRAAAIGTAVCYATAEHVLLARGKAWLVDFGSAGTGLQLFDVAAFLVTCGAEPAERRRLASAYAKQRGLAPGGTADLVDLAGIVWGISCELELPKRQILAMGDDAATEQLVLASARVNRAFREGAGTHPLAEEIRGALWPS
jgi:hypothetical protein